MEAILKIILIIVSISLIVVVLLQSGRSAGLSGAISGASEQIMGKKQARGIDAVLRKLTVVLATIFILLSLIVSYVVQ
jgi:preprotein translocase subunit SecG